MTYAIISETLGLVDLRDDEQEAHELALAVAVNTGRTAYVKPAGEVRG